MKVCLINHSHKPFISSGAENVVETIVDDFIKNGEEVIVITTKPRFWQQTMPMLTYRVFYLSSFFHSLSSMPYIVRFFWHILNVFDFFTANKVRQILTVEKPDLVITNNLAGLSYFIPRAIKICKIKHIHILHDIQLLHPSGLLIFGREKKINSFCSRIYQLFLKVLFNKVDVVVSPSNWLLDLHAQKGFFKIARKKVLANPVNIRGEYEKPEKKDIFQLLYAAQIEEHKGIFFLVETFLKLQKINKAGRQIKLKIIGGGSGEEKLKSLINGNDNIEYLGRVSRSEVYREMDDSDLLVIPSLCYENYPTVMVEGISNGLPILAAKIGGISEIINNYGGILFNPCDINDLIEKINLATKNPQLLEEIKNNYQRHRPQLANLNSGYVNVLLSL